jgi:tyrosine phenol-lyase
MILEPYKIKEVKTMRGLLPHERWNVLKDARFNTFHVPSDKVAFDLVARGMSAWSHFQKAAYMIGDEAYAGSANFIHLEGRVEEVLGLTRIVPVHNGIGAEKLMATTMIAPGQVVLHNRGVASGLVAAMGGESIDVTAARAAAFGAPEGFGGDVDLERLEDILGDDAVDVAYVHVETCPQEWNGQPVSLANLTRVRELTAARGVPLAVDISNVVINAHWIRKAEGDTRPIEDIVRGVAALADVVLLDASQDCRSDVGGFITSTDDAAFERFRNKVVVFEGLHSYGGMTGRAMEVFAVGLSEMIREEYTDWYAHQVAFLHGALAARGVPVHHGGKGIALDAGRFLPHLGAADHPKHTLAACLYLQGGIRGRVEGTWAHHAGGAQANMLMFELPRCAYTKDQLREVASLIAAVYDNRAEITGLQLLNTPKYVDEARFEPHKHRLFVSFPSTQDGAGGYERYKIAIFEPLKLTDKELRREYMREAGYNTFLLRSEDIYIDFLTDSGTTAMSCHQWEGMTNSSDTPYSNRHYLSLVEDFREILGYNYIIPTHQGRAAEHIMSQVMVKPGQLVPGNMYFTTTKLHQEMARGVFRDIICDEAHDPASTFPWKGNIDIDKLEALVAEHGGENVAYISFEMSVNMAGGQPFSMDNVKAVSRICQKHGIPVMFDATRCVENSYMIKRKDPRYAHKTVKEILREMLSYGDGCTISCKKDFLVNMGGILACNSAELNHAFQDMLRVWEGDITNGGMDPKDIEALHRGLLESIDDDYIHMRVEQTQVLGERLIEAGIPIVQPPGSHAIFLDAKRFLPHLDQDEYPSQALASALYIETGVRAMERGNVSKGRNPETGENYRPPLELVRLTIPRRVYTASHFEFVIEGIKRLHAKRDRISGLRFVYEPPVLRFFQGRFEPLQEWDF